ncbi:MAG: hypothetical protein RJA24_1682 [Pseudomonadota bacterium]|jgi:hypothetical protein
MDYTSPVIEIRETQEFSSWLESLRDARTRTRVQARILRLRYGNPGDVKPVGEGFPKCALITAPVIGFIQNLVISYSPTLTPTLSRPRREREIPPLLHEPRPHSWPKN